MPDWLTELSRLAGEARDTAASAATTRFAGLSDEQYHEAIRVVYAADYASDDLRRACSPERILALRDVVAAAKGAVLAAETDDDMDGRFVDWLVPDEEVAALRAALAALEATP